MTKTMHARSRRAAVTGLVLQLAAFVVALVLAYVTAGLDAPYTRGLLYLAWYLLGGAPIWLASVLVFRQRELSELEALDLEQLRREKEATGAGTAIFDEEGGGFRVAEARLQWMQSYLTPTFGLLTGLGLLVGGVLLIYQLVSAGLTLGQGPAALQAWGQVVNQPIAMIVLAVTMLATFLFSRYASGMGRVEQWQMLRGGGSYLLGNTLLIAGLTVGLGVDIYARTPIVLHVLAYLVPGVMVVLGAETLLNFVADVYRPRRPGVERRASFDSRLLGLISEPGGIAHSIAEAMNYQFGFEVSKTWFYQLLQRAFAPLAAVGALTLWLLTSLVAVQVDEHALVERFGRQLNADAPLGAGWHLKAPWPIDVVYKFNTGNVQQMYIGFEEYAAEPTPEERAFGGVVLWTDEKHLNRKHFDFLVPLTPKEVDRIAEATTELTQGGGAEPAGLLPALVTDEEASVAVPVNSMRMDVVVQYKIRPDALAQYTQHAEAPERTLRHLAWRRAVQFNASHDVESLLGPVQHQIGDILRQRVQADVDALALGLEVVYVGLQNIHPEASVAKAFRGVVNAEQEKIGLIREARVEENRRLSEVAGNKTLAQRLAHAIDQAGDYNEQLDRAQRVLGDAPQETAGALWTKLAELAPLLRQREQARWNRDRAIYARDQVSRDFEIGLRYTHDDVRAAEEQATAAEQRLAELDADVAEALDAVRVQSERPEEIVAAALAAFEAQIALDFWNNDIERQLPDLQGAAAVTLARARAERWRIEMRAGGELSRLKNERLAYRAAPEVYQAREFLKVQAETLGQSRKYFMAFEPNGRRLHIRYQAEEDAQIGLDQMDFNQE